MFARHAACIGRGIVTERAAAIGPAPDRTVWIVEDEPAAAMLAADLCTASGAVPSIFRDPLSFLAALRNEPGPAVVILDWRLERETSAGLFLATRHRYPSMPVICWTGSAAGALPAVMRNDRWAVVVEKGTGTSTFEEALAWALDPSSEPATEGQAAG